METAQSTSSAPSPHSPAAEEHAHPGPKEYIRIGVILAAVTAIEVAIYYIGSLRPLIVPLLLGLSFLKFSLVALWFMHLKFDSRTFRRLFVAGLILALVVYGSVLAMFLLVR